MDEARLYKLSRSSRDARTENKTLYIFKTQRRNIIFVKRYFS